MTKIDDYLKSINGTRRNMPQWANMTFDYSMFENGLVIDDDGSFMMAVNGTFFDGGKSYSTAYSPPGTFAFHFTKMFNG